MARVKAIRRYDASGRAEQARRTREAIIDIARHDFLQGGYAATTVAAIARKAGVSVETIYKSFGGKPGLVRAIHERGLAGRGSVPAPHRSDQATKNASDARELIREWGKLTAEVAPLVAPILLLVRAAAHSDGELAALLKDSDEQRHARMGQNARSLKARGFLRDGLTVEKATDVMWTYTSPELYELLVVRRGWTPQELGDFVASTLIATLLPPGRL